MRLRIILAALTVLFLFVAYFFISHAYIFLRLTTALGFIFVVFLLILVVALFGRLR